MIPFASFLNKRSKFEDIFRLADQLGLDSTECINPANKVLHSLKREDFGKNMERKLSYIMADFNFREFCEKKAEGNIEEYLAQDVTCGFCWGKRNTIMDDMLADKIAEDIADRKVIFLSINCEEYCLDREEEEGYSAHGTCAMLIPKRGGYNLYYMNPHGEVLKDYTYFEKIKTRTRVTKLGFDNAIIDCVIMKTLVDYINKTHQTNITYDYTMTHNYFGVNLQEEDNHGMCFIFPSIVYYYFGKYFTEKRRFLFFILLDKKLTILDIVSFIRSFIILPRPSFFLDSSSFLEFLLLLLVPDCTSASIFCCICSFSCSSPWNSFLAVSSTFSSLSTACSCLVSCSCCFISLSDTLLPPEYNIFPSTKSRVKKSIRSNCWICLLQRRRLLWIFNS